MGDLPPRTSDRSEEASAGFTSFRDEASDLAFAVRRARVDSTTLVGLYGHVLRQLPALGVDHALILHRVDSHWTCAGCTELSLVGSVFPTSPELVAAAASGGGVLEARATASVSPFELRAALEKLELVSCAFAPLGHPLQPSFALLIAGTSRAPWTETPRSVAEFAQAVSDAVAESTAVPRHLVAELTAQVGEVLLGDAEHDESTVERVSSTLGLVATALRQIVADDPALRRFGEIEVQILRPQRNALEVIYSTEATERALVPIRGSVAGRAFLTSTVQSVTDLDSIPYSQLGKASIEHSSCVAPIRFGDTVIALLAVEATRSTGFGGYPAILIEEFAAAVAAIVAMALAQQRTTEALERRAADETFVALGVQSASMIHSLHGSLGLLRVRTQRLARAVDLDQDPKQALAAVSQTLDDMVDQLGRFARVFRENDVIDLNETVREVAERRFRRDDELVVELRLDDGAGFVEEFMVEELLSNLIDNAARAAIEGSDAPRISIQTQVVRDDVGSPMTRVLVVDNGPGFSAANLRRLFESKVDSSDRSSQSAPGMGLGLFLSRKIALRNGGDVRILESTGTGSQFEVTLPQVAPPTVTGDPHDRSS